MIDSSNRDFRDRITPVMHGRIHPRILAIRTDTIEIKLERPCLLISNFMERDKKVKSKNGTRIKISKGGRRQTC